MAPPRSNVGRLHTHKLANHSSSSWCLAIESRSDRSESLIAAAILTATTGEMLRGRLIRFATQSVLTDSGVLDSGTAEDGRPYFVTELLERQLLMP